MARLIALWLAVLLVACTVYVAVAEQAILTADDDVVSFIDQYGGEFRNDGSNCPQGCSGKGICENSRCYCAPGYGGIDCSVEIPCKNNCNKNGQCRGGVCFCFSGYAGDDCSQESESSTSHLAYKTELEELVLENVRRWYRLYMKREADATGERSWVKAVVSGKNTLREVHDLIRDSEEANSCLNDCSGRGECVRGICQCTPGWGTADCSRPVCINDCMGNGFCVKSNGTCLCNTGWGGKDCGTRVCPNDCSAHGRCENGMCICDDGWTDLDCGKVACPKDCSGHGACQRDGTCLCDAGWGSLGCDEPMCLKNCSYHGACTDGRCSCYFGWEGDACEHHSNYATKLTAAAQSYWAVNHVSQLPEQLEFASRQPITLEAWVKIDRTEPITCADVDFVILDKFTGKGNVDSSAYRFFINACNNLEGQLGFYNNDAGPMNGNTKLAVNEWHHVAFVYDGKVGTFFVNGTEDGSAETRLGNADNNQLLIGRDITGRWFDGQMDELRIWSTARNNRQVREFMGTELSGREPGLVLYYRFNEGRGDYTKSTAKDTLDARGYRGVQYVKSTAPVTVFPDDPAEAPEKAKPYEQDANVVHAR